MPTNPLYDWLENEKNCYLLEKSDTTIKYESQDKSKGMPYVDQLVWKIRYEVYAMSADAKKSVIRFSYNLEWIEEPMRIIASNFESLAIGKI